MLLLGSHVHCNARLKIYIELAQYKYMILIIIIEVGTVGVTRLLAQKKCPGKSSTSGCVVRDICPWYSPSPPPGSVLCHYASRDYVISYKQEVSASL